MERIEVCPKQSFCTYWGRCDQKFIQRDWIRCPVTRGKDEFKKDGLGATLGKTEGCGNNPPKTERG